MSIFPNAHNFQVFGGEFHSHENHYGQTGIDILLEASAPEASVESEEVYKRTCCPGTREQQIASITDWATSESSVEPILWMRGPAGVGKSSIATTCAQNLQASGHLGAAFFFSINGRRGDHTRFFPTIAYQLSTILPDYHDVLNRKIISNKNILKTAMPSQFRALIVEPLQELERRGILIGRRTIFVDGLDECKSKDAQAEIIELIAASVRKKSARFRWAIFSREEPRTVATFQDCSISPYCRLAYLPISPETSGEIELYLRSGFSKILQRRNLLHLAPSWPNEGDMLKLVDAAAGLFAHPATVLRFIDHHSYLGFEEALRSVLDATLRPRTQTTSPFSELDALYMLIMQQIPMDILPLAQLLLSHLTMGNIYEGERWLVALICNQLAFSATTFAGIHNHLHAVVAVQKPDLDTTGIGNDLIKSDLDRLISKARPLLQYESSLLHTYGTIQLYHKSFHDFLTDSARSATFCVTTQSMREKLFDRFVQQHLHFERGHTIQGPRLVFSQDTPTSSLLSCPQGDEFVNEYLKLMVFYFLSDDLSHNHPFLSQFLKDVPTNSLRQLAEFDYRKFLIATVMALGVMQWSGCNVIGIAAAGTSKVIRHTQFIRLDFYNMFDPAAFLAMVEKLNELGIIRAFHSSFPSTLVSVYYSYSQRKNDGRNWGLYELGRGIRSVMWYWEFDTKERYFHEFRTTNYTEAMSLYETKKFEIWD